MRRHPFARAIGLRSVATILVVCGLAACGVSETSAAGSVTAARSELLRLAAAPHSLVLVFNPGVCMMDARQADVFNALNKQLGGRGRALVFGLTDSSEAARAVQDIGLDFAVTILTPTQAAAMTQLAPIPFLAVVRRGHLELIAGPSKFADAGRWLPHALGVAPSGRLTHGGP